MAPAIELGFPFTEEAFSDLLFIELELSMALHGGVSVEYLENCKIQEVLDIKNKTLKLLKTINEKASG